MLFGVRAASCRCALIFRLKVNTALRRIRKLCTQSLAIFKWPRQRIPHESRRDGGHEYSALLPARPPSRQNVSTALALTTSSSIWENKRVGAIVCALQVLRCLIIRRASRFKMKWFRNIVSTHNSLSSASGVCK